MKLRIYATVVSLAAAGLGVALWQERATSTALSAQVIRLSRQDADIRYELKQATQQATDFNQRAVELDSQLGSAKSRTTATESKQTLLTRELNDTKNRLTDREQREVALMAELATLRQKVAEAGGTPAGEPPVVLQPLLIMPSRAPATVAAAPAGGSAVPPAPAGDIAAYERRISELEQQLTQMLTRALAGQPATTPAAGPATPEPAPYQVVRVGPHDSFVVLDYGAEHGAHLNDILSLWHGTTEVARVQISNARPRFSLAQVLPATLKGQLQPGDLVVLTN